MPAIHLVAGGALKVRWPCPARLPVSVLGGVAGPQGRVPAAYMLHDGTETAQLGSPQSPQLLLLLLRDDLPPDLPTEGQLPALGRLYLPEDGEDLLPGQVGQRLLILLQGCGQQRDWLGNDKRSRVVLLLHYSGLINEKHGPPPEYRIERHVYGLHRAEGHNL